MLARRRRPLASRHTDALTDPILLAAVIGGFALFYVLIGAPHFNPIYSVDPWLYTALFTNFHWAYSHFGFTYYAARLPWIIPGLVANRLLAPAPAHAALHVAFGCLALTALYLLTRRFLGRSAALLATIWLAGNQLYFNANFWDYVDGPAIAYLLATCWLVCTQAVRARRFLAIAAAGVAGAAAAGTTLAVLPFAAGPVILYWFLARPRPWSGSAFGRDAAAFAAGAAALLAACGTFARLNGRSFLFFMPQVTALRTSDSSSAQPPPHWLGTEPRVLVPLVLLVAALAVLVVDRRANDLLSTRARPFAAASTAYLGLTTALLAILEFGFDRPIVYIPFNFDLLLPAMAFTFATVAVVAFPLVRPLRSMVAAVACAIAVALPVYVIYGRYTPSLVGRNAIVPAICLAATALALMGASVRFRRFPSIGALALVVLAFCTSYATAGSDYVFTLGVSQPQQDATWNVGIRLERLLNERGPTSESPYFWYDLSQPGTEAIQSLFFFSYTYVGTALPTIDAEFRYRMGLYRPSRLVLLCSASSCTRSAENALAAAGYRPRLLRRDLLQSGSLRLWVIQIHVRIPPSRTFGARPFAIRPSV